MACSTMSKVLFGFSLFCWFSQSRCQLRPYGYEVITSTFYLFASFISSRQLTLCLHVIRHKNTHRDLVQKETKYRIVSLLTTSGIAIRAGDHIFFSLTKFFSSS